MIVLDASAALDVLLGTPRAANVIEHLRDEETPLIAPDALIVEVARVLRRHVRSGAISEARALEAFDDLRDLDVLCYATAALLEGAWSLRANFSFDDALYVALADTTGASLLTTDRRLARATATHADVHVLAV